MAKETSLCLLFLSFLTVCCSGDTTSSTSSRTIFLQKNKISPSKIGIFVTDHRILRRILDDTNNSPPTVFPTNSTSPPDTPTIITVPSSTTPVTVSPSNPAAVPVTVPSTTPVPLSPTNPVTSPITVPGAQPATNPVTSYPPPSGNNVPANTNSTAPAIAGQSWCVAKNGTSETTLQSALDYACGMGSVDCSQIQQGGSCYNPNSMQNHASFAFNSYYQKNPAPTSCDFGGTATIVNTNPSTGSCIYPSSSSGVGTSTSSGNPPSAFDSSNPESSHSAIMVPFLSCIVMMISLVTGQLGMSP